ncbi:hypothetical protein BB559_004327 [Furculomyces boomerangus]|uniref:UspA domain-containing protein n=1 Tax=Furculomyces boomerangus TaxID=61424 RepID=A0A2T9YFG7_9FUNG|nr:hypothetical protein BB559_004327 [Furculomyces boomerangus]
MASKHPEYKVHGNEATADVLFHPHGHRKNIVAISIKDTKSSEKLLDWALNNIIDRESDTVVLINAHMPDRGVDLAVRGGYIESPLDSENEIERSHGIVNKFGHQLQDDGYHVQAFSLIGNPGQEIIKKITELNVTHLVLGEKGFSSSGKVIQDNVVKYITKHCKCAITIVKTT